MGPQEETSPLIGGSKSSPSLSRTASIASADSGDRRLRDVCGAEATTSTTVDHDSVSPSQSYTSCSAAIFLNVNAALGAGLLNFPHAFDSAGGLRISCIIEAVMWIVIVGALFILTHCTEQTRAQSFQELIENYCGRRTRKLTSLAIILYSYGACLTFLIIIGDQFDRVLASLHGSNFCHYWYMNRDFTMTTTATVLVLPLCFSSKIDFLTFSSSCGVFIIGYLLFLAGYEFYTTDTSNVVVKTIPERWTDIFNVLPAICFGYQCHLSWVPIYAGMKEKSSSPRLTMTILFSLIICFVAYTSVSAFGILTFGSAVNNDLMLNYDAKEALVLIGIAALAFKTVTTYPLLLFCARVAIEEFYAELREPPATLFAEKLRRAIIVLVWFVSSLVLAIFVPDIGVAVDLLGTLAVCFIFVLPGLCLIGATIRKDPTLTLLRDQLLCLAGSSYVLIGAFLFGLTLTQAIIKDFLSPPSDPIAPLCV